MQRGILVENRLLQCGKLGARVEAELGGEQLPPAPHGGEGIRLAPLAILREAQDHPAALAHRRLGDPRARLGRRVEQVTRLEAGFQERFLCAETDLFEPIGRDLRRLPVRQFGERLSAPQRESLRQSVRRAVGLAEFEQLRPPRDEPLELGGVEIDAIRGEPVSQRCGLDPRRGDDSAQSHDASGDHLRPRGGEIVSPQRRGEGLDGDRPADARGERADDQPITVSERDPAAVERQRPQNAQVHVPHCGTEPGVRQGH